MDSDTENDRQRHIAKWVDDIDPKPENECLINDTREQVFLNAKKKDLILLEESSDKLLRPYEIGRPSLYRLLIVAEVLPPRTPGIIPRIYARDIHRLDRRDFIELHIDTTYFYNHGQEVPVYPLDDFLKHNTKISLRPSLLQLRDTVFAGECAYERCNKGLMRLPPGIRDPQGTSLQLCIYCFGRELFDKQESLALFDITDPGTQEAWKDLLLEINWRRMQLGYDPLGIDMMQDLETPKEEKKHNSKAINSFSRPVNWFVGHLELDLGLWCPICKEKFQETEKVTMLHCGHTYHRECIAGCIDSRARGCPFGCGGMVRLD